MDSKNLLKRERDVQPAEEPAAKKMRTDFDLQSTPSIQEHLPATPGPSGDATGTSAEPSSPTQGRSRKGDAHKPSSTSKTKAQRVKAQQLSFAAKRKKDKWGPREPRERPEGEEGESKTRLPKKKVALLIGFCGTGCHGMQYNPPHRTIEGILFEALIKTGCVSADNADDPTKVSIARAARTDTGVHAAGNVVSMKIIREPEGVTDVVAAVNSHLPPQVRLWGMVRTQNNFIARQSCDSRVYEYLFPSYMLIPPKPGSKMAAQIASDKPISDEALAALAEQPRTGSVHPFWAVEDPSEPDLERKRRWRVGEEPLKRLRELVNAFEGTHNFYNYTVGKEFKGKDVKRYMMSLEVRDPQVVGDTEWISVKFHGQSFMLHQIRKMISMAILCCRASCPASLILESYGPTRIRIPKAPALGLLLEEPQFGAYNGHMVQVNRGLDEARAKGRAVPDQDYREPIDFGLYRKEIEAFKLEMIYEKLREREKETGTFDVWIKGVDDYVGYDFAFLNSRGIIPPEAVVTGAVVDRAQYDAEPKLRRAAGGAGPADEGEESDEDAELGLVNSEELEG
ncbi:pseudouridine synthase [Calocera cornea HHB12733]|uniref:Pseudouridine synthase n=1 Tax=Calocera cornea HHB12733 TaxID=1353952 RepID=A0A165HNA2_9BASI|nr:pseudouridine synthase [Calocera cornea HHB12733]